MSEEQTRLWCPSCKGWAVALRGKPNRWAHGFATLFTGGWWGIAWLVREVGHEAAKQVVPGWRCSRCGCDELLKRPRPQPHSDVDRNGDGCPQCGFSYKWKNGRCGHCGFVQQMRADIGPGVYRVRGVDCESHTDVEKTVEAASAANAKVKAELDGIIVTDVTLENASQ